MRTSYDPKSILIEALRETWRYPEDVTDDIDFSSFRGDWIAEAAIAAIDKLLKQ